MTAQTTITFIGHATLLIQTPGGKRILIDPFLTGNPVVPAAFKTVKSLGKLDAILVTHLHNDHCMEAVAAANANPEAPLIAVVEAADWFELQGVAKAIGMNKGGTFHQQYRHYYDRRLSLQQLHQRRRLRDLRRRAGRLHSHARKWNRPLRSRRHHGLRRYGADPRPLCTRPGDPPHRRSLHHGPKQAAYATKLLGVKHVLPIHYATFPVLTGTPEALRAHLGADSDVIVHALQPGETLTL